MYYICENDKPRMLDKMLNKIYIEGEKIKILPIPKLNLIQKADGRTVAKRSEIIKREKHILKIARKTVNILNEVNNNKVVLSKKLKTEKDYVNYLYSEDIDVIDGKFLFVLLTPEIIEYIRKKQKIDTKELKIAILVNDINMYTLGNIKKITHKYRNITIVTRHIARLKKLQTDMYKNEGIVVAVSNNKKKAISKTNIILNFDFPEELINKYNIYENANIVNFNQKIKILNKRFNGISIFDYEIKINKEKIEGIKDYDETIMNNNYLKDMYEAQLYKKYNYEILRRKILEDKVKIEYLQGINSKY